MADDVKEPDPHTPSVVEPAAEAPPPPPPPEEDWRDKEIAAKYRQIKERDQRLAEVLAENERLKQLAEAAARGEPRIDQSPSPPPSRSQSPEIDFDKRVAEKAAELRASEQAANLEVQLKADYPNDYDTIIRNFASLDGSFQLMFNDIMATDDAAHVVATLGKNPAEIQRIRDLPAAKRMAALLKIGMERDEAWLKRREEEKQKTEARRPSGAPPPPTANPPGASSPAFESANLYDPRYEFPNYFAGNDQIAVERERDEAWFARRQEQKRNSAGRPWSLGGKAGTGGRA